MTKLTFTKLDSARRQLELAIRLYFNESDPVSTHTLAGAANELLRGLTKHVGEEPMLKDTFLSAVKEDFKKEVAEKMQKAQNFFKHADRDPDGTLSFDPGETMLLLLDSCWAYRRISKERLPVLQTYELWSAITWAKDFVTYPGLTEMLSTTGVDVEGLSKRGFFERFVAIGHQADVGSDA